MIHPVVLAGGSGTRLWPVSRKAFPKQFADISGSKSLFRQCLGRLSSSVFAAPMVMTGEEYRFIAVGQMEEEGSRGRIMIEPEGRNTAPAILTAAVRMDHSPEALLLVLPSDHAIRDEAAFLDAVKRGEAAARDGAVVTFGVTPDRAEPGFGYLEIDPGQDSSAAMRVTRFVEKPPTEQAARMVEGKRQLWNAGIYMARVDVLIAAFEAHCPEMLLPVRGAVQRGRSDLDFFRLEAESYGRCENISIDFAVTEKLDDLMAVQLDCGWADLGNWQALHAEEEKDNTGNVLRGDAKAVSCTNSLLMNQDGDTALVGVGLDNIAAIATRDAVLVADLDKAGQIGTVLEELRQEGRTQADGFLRCHRPWGYYETLSLGSRFQVKRIMVKPGAQLSLQSHVHRAEHWVVVEGSAMVTVGDSVSLLGENQSTYIPLGAVHRLENPGKLPLHLIEVQSGAYLGEDDIERYEDIYDRAGVA
jgi:mannose-1-phosphate guanylyltransferase/mannose-1-phosphate guanylyltransferase/mannose-6-phosphate isomerase